MVVVHVDSLNVFLLYVGLVIDVYVKCKQHTDRKDILKAITSNNLINLSANVFFDYFGCEY